jgi:hypothetical protein
MDVKYGFSDLPKTVRKYIWNNAAKLAGWKNSSDPGKNGLIMDTEWTTFALTIDGWILAIAHEELPISRKLLKSFGELRLSQVKKYVLTKN